jgi:hypothetical protein
MGLPIQRQRLIQKNEKARTKELAQAKEVEKAIQTQIYASPAHQ